jgi:hypothetical protein
MVMFGSDAISSIINVPEATIVVFGAIKKYRATYSFCFGTTVHIDGLCRNIPGGF